MAQINSFRDLIVYQKGYKLAMEIFEISKNFPIEEKYSLTDQIRRSSRSVTTNIAEVWAKKMYVKHFVSKLTDSLGEEYETEVWLDYSQLTIHYSLLTTHLSLLTTHRSLLTTHYSLLTTHNSLLTTHHSKQ